jgi:hypothetical protein
MSDELTKYRHSKRRHKDQVAIDKQVKIAKQHGLTMNNEVLKEPHRLFKHHVMDCGNPRCVVCSNPRKLYSEKTIQEKRFEQPEIYNED